MLTSCLKEVWGIEAALDTHTLETHIYRLRGKCKELAGDELVEAVEGGVCFEMTNGNMETPSEMPSSDRSQALKEVRQTVKEIAVEKNGEVELALSMRSKILQLLTSGWLSMRLPSNLPLPGRTPVRWATLYSAGSDYGRHADGWKRPGRPTLLKRYLAAFRMQ